MVHVGPNDSPTLVGRKVCCITSSKVQLCHAPSPPGTAQWLRAEGEGGGGGGGVSGEKFRDKDKDSMEWKMVKSKKNTYNGFIDEIWILRRLQFYKEEEEAEVIDEEEEEEKTTAMSNKSSSHILLTTFSFNSQTGRESAYSRPLRLTLENLVELM